MPAKKHEMPTPTESAEQQALFEWAAIQGNMTPELSLLYHIPNGGYRSKAEAGRFKAEGVKSGVPDVCLPVARGGFHGLYIELKRRKGGKVTHEQEKWIKLLSKQGYIAIAVRGWEKAAEAIMIYLRLENKRE
jgi:hypothetical protein